MTREEAIKVLNNFPIDFRNSRGFEAMEALKIAILALRPVSREQVEKVWRGEWVGVPNMGVYDTACSKCGYCPGISFWDSDFCPVCGAAQNDKAVDMVMERVEALRDET